jgi:hypothetical protein
MKRWTMATACLALAVACGDKEDEEPEDDTADGGGEEGGDDDTAADGPITYPSGDRALLYYGHGGWEPDGFDKGLFERIDARWKDQFGWNTDHRNSWSDDLAAFRMIGLIAPTDAFSADEIAALQGAMANGTRIVLFGDRGSCGSAAQAALLDGLGVGMGFTGDSADENQIVQTDSYAATHPITDGLSQTLRLKEPCYVDPTGGAAIVRDQASSVLAAVQRPGRGGDVVVIGDFQFMDDGGYLDHGDNALLADGLVLVEEE